MQWLPACRGGPHSSLMFCTNGVLLRALTHGEGLEGITHVIVDEVHERDKFADFLLIQLREVLPKHPHLRLVLMSATMHLDLFQGYFQGCPVVEVGTPAAPQSFNCKAGQISHAHGQDATYQVWHALT